MNSSTSSNNCKNKPQVQESIFVKEKACRDACQITERYDHYNIQSRYFETSRDLTVRHEIRRYVLLQAWCGTGQELHYGISQQHKAAVVTQVALICIRDTL